MSEWNVYINDVYAGTVFEDNEALARCAAWSKFDPAEDAEISVSKR